MSSSPQLNIEALAFTLLEALRRRDTDTREPSFAHDFAAELGLGQGDCARAFRYLADKGWIDTFSIPYAGRINAHGHDALSVRDRQFEQPGPAARAAASPAVRGATVGWDVFISHASEDKAAIALPLAERLQAAGLRVWLDKFELTVGDSLRRSIDAGLAESRFGIVIISPNFLQKHWPQLELDGLAARESEGIKIILPVWHQIDAATVRKYSPTLSDRLAVSSDIGVEHVAQELLRAIGRDHRVTAAPAPTAAAVAAPAIPTAALLQAARTFHGERTERIATGNGPIAVLDGGMLILHVMPNAAADDMPAAAFEELAHHPERFPPMKGRVQEVQIGYDGMLIGSNAKGLGAPQRAYVPTPARYPKPMRTIQTIDGISYLSVTATAGLLGLTVAQVRSQLVAQGVAYTVAGGRLWLDRAHVESWVARRALDQLPM